MSLWHAYRVYYLLMLYPQWSAIIWNFSFSFSLLLFMKRIPPAFLKHVVHDLTKRATLKLKNSSNCSWTVKVSTTGRDVYLKDGWQKFLRDNSLGDSEFLQFRYVRNMNFIVTIFDKNCVERVNIADIRTHEASTFPDKTKRRLGRPPIGNNSGVTCCC